MGPRPLPRWRPILLGSLLLCATGAVRCLLAQDGVDFTPDAKLVAYALRDTLWLISTERGAAPRPIGQGGMPHFSPTGRLLAFYSTASGPRQLWVLDTRTLQRREVTRVRGGIETDEGTRFAGWVFDPFQYGWSPDGTRLVFTSLLPATHKPMRATPASSLQSSHDPHKDRRVASPLVLTNDTPLDWTLLGLFKRDVTTQFVANKTADNRPIAGPVVVRVSHLFVVSVETGATTQLTSDDGGYFNPDWSPDGTQIVAVALRGRDLSGWGPEQSDLCTFEVATHKRACITTGPGQKRLPRWAPDGRSIAYLGGPKFAPSAVFVMPAGGGDPRNVTARLDRFVIGFDWSADGRVVFVAYRDGLEAPMAKVDVPSGNFERVDSGVVALEGCGFGGFARHLPAWRTEPSGSDAAAIRVLASVDSLPRSIAHPADPDLLPSDVYQEVLRWKNSRGDEIEGLVLRSKRSRNGRAPLLVNAYSQFLNVARYRDEARLARAGFVVLLPDHRAPHMWMNVMKTPRYDGAAVGPNGIDVLHDDVMSGIDTLIARGFVDSSRMCVYGFSNGGLSALFLLMRTKRFKCASVAAPATPDWPGGFFLGNTDGVVKYMHGATPWSDPGVYVALSPVYHLDQIKTPLLLSVGDDDQTHVIALLGVYNGLRYLGRPVTLLRYPGQGHQLEGPAKADFERRQLEFFKRYLTPDRADRTPGS